MVLRGIRIAGMSEDRKVETLDEWRTTPTDGVVPARSAALWSPQVEEPKVSPTILLIDSNEISRRVLKAMLKSAPYKITEATQPTEALAIVDQREIDLIIIDLVMPEVSGADLCRRIKASRRTQLIPILMLTNVRGIENEIAGIQSGADEFLTKPLHPEVVRTRVRAMLRNKAAIDSLEEAETILFALAQAVETRDRTTGDHCQRLAEYSVALGRALGLPQPQLVALHRGGYLHDIGKVGVPDSILFKQGSLTEEEWKVMKFHTVKGEEICRPMKSLAPVLPIIRSHHERWDGSGYPDGLKGEDIPLLARILQIADVYDALTTERPYKPAHSSEEAFRILDEEARRGWRDIELLTMFHEIREGFPPSDSGRGYLTWGDSPVAQDLDKIRRQLGR